MPTGDRKLTMDELDRVGVDGYSAAQQQRIRVVLDDVRSRHNVGSIFRTSDAFGVERMHLCGFTPLPPHREIEKTALGATASVPWEHAPNTLEVVMELKRQGFTVVAVEQTVQAEPLQERLVLANGPLALVFGNEVNGVSDEVIEACDHCVVVPQRGTKHSLNVSVCAGVVLHAFMAAADVGNFPKV
ncbi:MAG TPA: RNA methyltransferase [Flavobacteriales bacterium]|nr:RNA methyltransferase [Flavobacteriales bacterium]